VVVKLLQVGKMALLLTAEMKWLVTTVEHAAPINVAKSSGSLGSASNAGARPLWGYILSM